MDVGGEIANFPKSFEDRIGLSAEPRSDKSQRQWCSWANVCKLTMSWLKVTKFWYKLK